MEISYDKQLHRNKANKKWSRFKEKRRWNKYVIILRWLANIYRSVFLNEILIERIVESHAVVRNNIAFTQFSPMATFYKNTVQYNNQDIEHWCDLPILDFQCYLYCLCLRYTMQFITRVGLYMHHHSKDTQQFQHKDLSLSFHGYIHFPLPSHPIPRP